MEKSPSPKDSRPFRYKRADDSVLGNAVPACDRLVAGLLLNLAITPAMLRRAFTPDTDPEIAEAMLRYFHSHPGEQRRDSSGQDRSLGHSTFLYRHPRVPGQWERRGYGLGRCSPACLRSKLLWLEILADADVPSLTEEHDANPAPLLISCR